MSKPNSELDGQWTTDWTQTYSHRAQRMTSSVIRELLKYTQQPDVISFAGGMPAPSSFPIREVREACNYILKEMGPQALQYGPTEGYPPLKDYLAESMQKYGIPAVKGNILLTSGSQQALDMIGKAFIDEGTSVIIGRPTYLGALQAWNMYGPRYFTVPLDENGMQVDKIEDILKQEKAKFIYILPNFHNPAGVTLSLERRHRLIEVAAKHGTFIVEDDPYGELRYEGEDIVPIVALHKENTIYLSTFSKTLSPGIRLGWIVAPEEVILKLVQVKQGADLHTSTFIQYIAADICNRGLLKGHIKYIRQMYRERRDVMLAAMEKHFPPGVTWTRPQGGLFLWAIMPKHVDAEQLLQVALKEEKVAFVPGTAFYPQGDASGRHCMRLNFSNAKPEMIQEGIERLGKVLVREFG